MGCASKCFVGVKKIAGEKCSEDVVVPLASVPEFLIELSNIKHGTGIPGIGVWPFRGW